MPSPFPQSRMMEIPVRHEMSHYPQRTSTPPRVSTPPRTESPTFYTLPRNHRVQPQQERVREIPIQHFTSRSMSPSRSQVQGRPEPNPDYPTSRDSTPTSQTQMPHGPPQPQPSYPQYSQPQGGSGGNGYPRKQEYPQQVYPPPQQQSYHQQQAPYPPSSQSYPQSPTLTYPHPQQSQQGYPQSQQGYPSQQQNYPQPQQPKQSYPHSGYPSQQPQSRMDERQKRFPTPEECRPPQHEEFVHNIPIIREDLKEPKQGFGTWPRQPKQQRSSIPNDMKSDTMPNQKSQDQNQNARDQPDSGKAPQEGIKKTDNNVKSEPPKQVKPKTPIEMIEAIANECKDLEDQVMNFKGSKKDKQYKFLEEMLTRSILKLDGIESGGDEATRQARKRTVREIQSFLDQLELKAYSQGTVSSSAGQKMDTDLSQSSNIGDSGNESMDTSGSENIQAKSDKTDDRKVKEMVLDSEVSC